jgi:hypothetical protein
MGIGQDQRTEVRQSSQMRDSSVANSRGVKVQFYEIGQVAEIG